jgi:diguanylate cyclase (GGDEF)-like protein
MRRDTDSISRVGGEEFMLLLPHTTVSGGAILAERLRQRLIDLPIPVGSGTIAVTASFGVSELSESGDPERMLIDADDALYRAKQSGRNCIVTLGRSAPARSDGSYSAADAISTSTSEGSRT